MSIFDVTTADGIFDSPNQTMQPCYDCADSFVKLSSTLAVASSFTPADQACRFYYNPQMPKKNPDLDFGSGGVMLIPDGLLSSWPYLAVSADKNQNIYAMQRQSPGFYHGGSTCTNGTNSIPEVLPGTGQYHNTPAFWKTSASAGNLYASSIGGAISEYPVNSSCTFNGQPAPICAATHTSSDSTGQSHTFFTGTTPTVSSSGGTNGIVWALDGFSVEAKTNGALWAFNATDMTHLYNSTLCQEDAIHSATQFSVPTVANGRVYVGAQSDNNSTPGKGTFYIFGLISNKTCTP